MVCLPRFTFLLLAWLLSSLPVLPQSSLFNVTEADFFNKTHLIFVGKLVGKWSHWSNDHRFIMTRHIFLVQDSIKGDPGHQVEITEYGGIVGDQIMTVTHGAHYQLGLEYLVFSRLDSLQRNRTLAGPLGQFQVIKSGSDQRVVRIYPSHPLAASLGRSTFQEVNVFSSRLRATLQKSSSEQD